MGSAGHITVFMLLPVIYLGDRLFDLYCLSVCISYICLCVHFFLHYLHYNL